MARILVLLLGLAIIGFAVKYELTGTRASRGNLAPAEVETGIKPVQASGEHTRPRQELDNVRDRSHELEKEMQKRVDQNAGAAEEH